MQTEETKSTSKPLEAKISLKKLEQKLGSGAAAPAKPAEKKKKGPAGPLDLKKFGLETDAQWLLTIPARYADFKTFTEFDALMKGATAMVRGTIVSKKMVDENNRETNAPRAVVRVSVTLRNSRGQTLGMTAFGRPGFAWFAHKKGDQVIVRGVVKENTYKGGLDLAGIEVVQATQLGKIVPIYPNIKVTKGERFAERVNANLGLLDTASHLIDASTGWKDLGWSAKLKELTHFENGEQLLRALHRPESVEQGEKARRAAKMLSAWELIRTTNKRVASIEVNPKSIINVTQDQINALKTRIPFPLTLDQASAIDGICKSLRSPLPMRGLLTGDVGSGKTLAFLLPMMAVAQAGKRAVLMTPNLLLIHQVRAEIKTLFPEVEICVAMGKGIEGDPFAPIVIGTTALLNAMKKGQLGPKPDFLVVDEQHKFSVEQRESMIEAHTNALEATATPIPRTAALATHGAKDLYMLKQIPVEKKITSEIMTGRHQKLQAANVIMQAVIEKGEQAAVIYPIVTTQDESLMKKSVVESAAVWARQFDKHGFNAADKIAVLHGKMKDTEKEAILNAFKSGAKRLLLASTVIEVGVTLPELKTMLVVGADTMGIVTLHQLRGRLARKGGIGHFMMYHEDAQEDAIERLTMLRDHNDGFELAEKDAEYRGYGDMLGGDDATQSGKMKTLFLGADVGPRQLSFFINLDSKMREAETNPSLFNVFEDKQASQKSLIAA